MHTQVSSHCSDLAELVGGQPRIAVALPAKPDPTADADTLSGTDQVGPGSHFPLVSVEGYTSFRFVVKSALVIVQHVVCETAALERHVMLVVRGADGGAAHASETFKEAVQRTCRMGTGWR